MDAAATAALVTPAYTAAAYASPVPVKNTDATRDAGTKDDFRDLVAANLKADDQTNDTQVADADKAAAQTAADQAAAKSTDSAAQQTAAADARKAAKPATLSPAPAQPSAPVATGVTVTTTTQPAAATSVATPVANGQNATASLDPALNKQVAALVGKLLGVPAKDGTTPATTAAARKKLTQSLDTLLAGLPADQRQAALTALQTTLAQGASLLTTSGAAAAQAGGALIAAGVTPQQLTDLTNALNNALAPNDALAPPPLAGAPASPTGPASDADEDNGTPIVAGATTVADAVTLPAIIQLTTPPLQRDPIFSLRTAPVAGPAKSAAATDKAIKETAAIITAQLTSLTKSDGGQPDSRAAHPFDNVLQIFARSQNGAVPAPAAGTIPAATPATVSAAVRSAATILIATATTPSPAAVTTASQAGNQTANGDGTLAAQASAAAAAPVGSTPLVGPAMFTSLITNVAAAGAAHPATQAVASAVLQAGEDGEDSNITVSLDPAELGKVQVRLQIGKDASVKAHLLVEKPETYLMLQRDQHVLQKHLQDSGLDANGSSLSFELAQGGMNFGQDNREGNASQGGTGSGDNNKDVGTVLETTMTWTIDPQNGQTHYNLLA